MNNTMDALKALFIALGGNEEDFTATIIPEAIEQIAGIASGGGGGGSSSGGIYPVVLSNFNGSTGTADHTASEIYSAVSAKQYPVMFDLTLGSAVIYWQFGTGAEFVHPKGGSAVYVVDASGNVTVTEVS